jgi:hypothetical protein
LPPPLLLLLLLLLMLLLLAAAAAAPPPPPPLLLLLLPPPPLPLLPLPLLPLPLLLLLLLPAAAARCGIFFTVEACPARNALCSGAELRSQSGRQKLELTRQLCCRSRGVDQALVCGCRRCEKNGARVAKTKAAAAPLAASNDSESFKLASQTLVRSQPNREMFSSRKMTRAAGSTARPTARAGCG